MGLSLCRRHFGSTIHSLLNCKGRKSALFRRFTHLVSFETVASSSSWNLGYESRSQKLEFLGYRRRKPRDPTVINFDALPACDGQTDRQPVARALA